MKLRFSQEIPGKFIPALSLLCLLAAGILECVALLTLNDFIIENLYSAFKYLSAFFSLIAALSFVRRSLPFRLLPAIIMVVWFLFIQYHLASVGGNAASMGLFLATYLLAFPFAAVTQDAEKQTGLKLFACICIVFSAMLALISGLLVLERLPAVFQKYVYWYGTRLQIVHHPNIVARTFMIAIAFCLGFFTQVREKWIKAVLLAAIALMFYAESLTNSRSAVLLTCAMIAAIVFFFLFKQSWKHFAIASVAAVAILIVSFSFSQFVFQRNEARLNKQHTASSPSASQQIDHSGTSGTSSDPFAAITLSAQPMKKKVSNPSTPKANKQGSLLQDISTLNSRTRIWSTVFKRIQENPSLLLWGCDSTRDVLQMFANHTHNSWLEILLRLGLPGFLLSVLFTAYAVWFSLRLLFTQQASLWAKTISILTLTLLASGFVEPALFFTYVDYHPHDFTFFLCTGYLMEYYRLLRGCSL